MALDFLQREFPDLGNESGLWIANADGDAVIDFLAQGSEPTGWAAVGIQLASGTLLTLMMKWMMGVIDTKLTALADAQALNTKERTDSNANLIRENAKFAREISESNDRTGRAQLLLVIAVHQVDEALKNQAKGLIVEIDEAKKSRERG